MTLIPEDDGFKIELQGRLALLMQAPNLYPNMRIAASGGSMVAEARYRRSPNRCALTYLEVAPGNRLTLLQREQRDELITASHPH